MWQSKREISRECNDIIGSAKGSQISEKYWGEVGKGKRADVYLEVRKMRGHIYFEWNKCLWFLSMRLSRWSIIRSKYFPICVKPMVFVESFFVLSFKVFNFQFIFRFLLLFVCLLVVGFFVCLFGFFLFAIRINNFDEYAILLQVTRSQDRITKFKTFKKLTGIHVHNNKSKNELLILLLFI